MASIMYYRLLLLTFIALFNTEFACSSTVLQIGSEQQIADGIVVRAGEAVEIEIWGSALFSTATLSGYRLAFDLDTYGNGHSGSFESMGASFDGGLLENGSFIYADSDMVGHDLLVSASAFPSVRFPTTPTKLFSVIVSVASDATAGEYQFNWRSNSDATFNGNPANILTGNAVSGNQITATGLTSFRVTAVPEPSSFAVLGIGAALLTARRNHKRRKQQMVTLE